MTTRRTHNFRLLTVLTALLFLAAACNLPRKNAEPTASGVQLINTAAAQTVNARMTQIGQSTPGSEVGTPIPPTTGVPAGGTPAAPLPTATGGSTSGTPAAAAACDEVKFLEDVTYPDNSEVPPGTQFVKTWSVQNAGTCTWTTSYALVFAGKDRMSAPDAVPLAGNVAPGQTINLSVTLTAPVTAGTYRADFKLRNANNDTFGIGADNGPLFVQIKVPGSAGSSTGAASGSGFDFNSRASSATWVSGVGSTLDTNLTFGGAQDDPNGAAAIKDQAKLENKATSGKVLLTVPKHDPNGVISGTFPAYTVQRGDHLKARLGFMANADGSCGAGNVTFQISYKESDTVKALDKWEKTCTGSLLPIDIDLSGLRGRSVQFIFTVTANGTAQDNWAIWNSAQIVQV